MSKGNNGKKKNKKRNKGKTTTKKPQNSKVQTSLEEESQKAQVLKLKHENRQTKIKNVSETIEQLIISLMKLSCFIAFALALIAIFIFVFAAIYFYISKQSVTATIVLTVLQVLTGLVSVVIGIWALVLTIQSNRKNSTTQNKLNIVVSSADTIVTQVQEEIDVNPKSL